MAEPVSISSLVLQVAVVAGRVYDYGKQIKQAANDIRDLYAELLALKGILEQMEKENDDAINAGQQEIPRLFSSQPVHEALSKGHNLLKNLLDDLDGRQVQRSSLLGNLRNLGWPRTRTQFQEKVQQLERLKSYFILVMMRDTS